MSEVHPPSEAGYFRVFEHPSGGLVDVHERHGKQESSQNLPVAIFLAARGEQVRLLPVSDLPGIKSPDAARDGVVWEFKIPEGRSANTIDKALRDGSKQAARILLKLPADFDRQRLSLALVDRVQRTSAIQEVAILMADKLLQLSRLEILANAFEQRLP